MKSELIFPKPYNTTMCVNTLYFSSSQHGHELTILLSVATLIWLWNVIHICGFLGSSEGKESGCNAWDPGLIPGSGRTPWRRAWQPLQYSCLENPMDRGAWRATVHRVTKSQTWLKQLSMQHACMPQRGSSIRNRGQCWGGFVCNKCAWVTSQTDIIKLPLRSDFILKAMGSYPSPWWSKRWGSEHDHEISLDFIEITLVTLWRGLKGRKECTWWCLSRSLASLAWNPDRKLAWIQVWLQG